jgi:HK97 family phage prohead protease
MSHERRSVRAEVRTVEGDKPGRFEAVVLRYGVVDDYGTSFRAGAFAESLADRLPRICWAHQWSEPIGRWVDYRDGATDLTLVGELDDFDAVPRARQADAQLRSGTIDQFSVGFVRQGDEKRNDGVVEITKGILDEASLVLVGAVPGTQLVSIRSAGGVGMVAEDLLVALAKKVQAGEMSEHEAQIALGLAAGEVPPAGNVGPGAGGDGETESPNVDDVIEELLGDHPDLERWLT